MNGLKKHIARILLTVFLLPVTISPVHQLFAHSHLTSNEEYHCEQEYKKGITGFAVSDETGAEEICLICSFEFPVYELHNQHFFKAFIPITAPSFNVLTSQDAKQQTEKSFRPRGPPATV